MASKSKLVSQFVTNLEFSDDETILKNISIHSDAQDPGEYRWPRSGKGGSGIIIIRYQI